MEAARVSALRGHDVTLYEKQPKLGGLLPIAAIVKGPASRGRAADRATTSTGRSASSGVKVVTGKAADMATVDQVKPDVVFLATGASATIPAIKGIDRPNVVSGAALHKKLKMVTRFVPSYTLRSLTKYYMPMGKNVVVIGGGAAGLRAGRVPGEAGPERHHRGAGGHVGRGDGRRHALQPHDLVREEGRRDDLRA